MRLREIQQQKLQKIIVERIDEKKENLGLTTFRGNKPTKEEIIIAKNYYNKEELLALNALVEQYLVFATEQARRRIPMNMKNWIEKLNGFLTINDRNILEDAGKISHELMIEITKNKFSKYKKIEAKKDIDFDKVALEALENAKSHKIKTNKSQ